jgi:hypothetical protein
MGWRRWLLVGVLVATLVGLLPLGGWIVAASASGGRAARASVSSAADLAITGFSGRPTRLGVSVARLDEQFLFHRDDLRAAALRQLGDGRADVRYAAVYALALTAAPGPAEDALRGLLTAPEPTNRLLAAAALAGIGGKEALPVLIGELGSGGWVGYSEPPVQGWQLARLALLVYTGQDFGLRGAQTRTAAARSQKAWRRWWASYGSALRWDPNARRYTLAGGASDGSSSGRRSGSRLASAAAAGGAAGTTSVTASGTTVTITIPIDFFGGPTVHDGANGAITSLDARVALWKLAAERRWNEAFKHMTFTQSCAGGGSRKTHFRLVVDVHVYPQSFLPLDRSGHHRVLVVDSGPLNGILGETQVHTVGQNDYTDPYGHSDDGVWTSAMNSPSAAHEISHLLGLADDYAIHRSGKSYTLETLKRNDQGQVTSGFGPSRAGTLMDYRDGRIDQQLVDRLGRILAKIGKLPSCKKSKPIVGLVRGPWSGRTSAGKIISFDVDDSINSGRIEFGAAQCVGPSGSSHSSDSNFDFDAGRLGGRSFHFRGDSAFIHFLHANLIVNGTFTSRKSARGTASVSNPTSFIPEEPMCSIEPPTHVTWTAHPGVS